MNEEDLELLVTLDDPEDPEKEDTFHDPPADNTVDTPGQTYSTKSRPNVDRSKLDV